MDWFWAKFLVMVLDCFALSEPWMTVDDSFITLQVKHIAGGDELVLDLRMHVLNTAAFSVCMQLAKDGLVPCLVNADCQAVQFCSMETGTCVDL